MVNNQQITDMELDISRWRTKKMKFSDLKRKVVVLLFYPADLHSYALELEEALNYIHNSRN